MTSESWSIHEAARKNNLAALRRYLDAGVSPDLVADDGYCLLMKAGGALKLDPDPERNGWLKRSPYLKKVNETPGGFPAYEKAHRQRLTEIFLPKLPSLPAEIVSHIVSFGFHCGCSYF